MLDLLNFGFFVWNQWEEAYHKCPEQKSVLEETGASPDPRYGGMYVWKDFPARELRHQTGRAGQSHFCAQRWILLIRTMHKCKKQESNLEVFAGNHNYDVCALKLFMLALLRAMQVLPVTFMKQSESNKKCLRNLDLDLMLFRALFHFWKPRGQQILSVVGTANPFFSKGRAGII